DFDLTFYLEGNLITSDVYDIVPVKGCVVNSNGIQRREMVFRILDETRFQLETVEKEKKSQGTYAFNDTINFLGLEMVFTIKDRGNLKRYIDTPFLLVYTAPAIVTGSYIG